MSRVIGSAERSGWVNAPAWFWYRHLGYEDGTPRWTSGNGKKVGNRWGGFAHVIGGADGLIYAVQPNGDLLWYRHLGYEDGTPQWASGSGRKVGDGWGGFINLFGGTDGVIYAVQPNGDLLWYRHLGYEDGTPRWTSGNGKKVGNGWGGFTSLFGSRKKARRAPASKLLWRVRWWIEHEADDSGLQGATDETAIEAVGLDTSRTAVVGGKAVLERLQGGRIDNLRARRDNRPDLQQRSSSST